MQVLLPTRKQEIRFFCGFMGLAGGAKGFANGHARVEHVEASFRCIGGFDVDAAAARDARRIANAHCEVIDLFDRSQYVAFHGHEPPSDWREATADDIRRAGGGEDPHIVFLSPPCKGFSGLLSESRSKSAKYQALNRLTIRSVKLMLEAWADNPPEFFLLENVPRIATRGRALLDEIVSLLQAAGYATAETTHDCGELGGLAQTRKRFLLVARHREKVPPFLYEPYRRPLRAVGDVLGAFPLPGDPASGPMHRMRSLQWKTWVRLALVEAGGDWRSLQKLRVVDGSLADFCIMPDNYGYPSALGVTPWEGPSGTVTGEGRPSNGRFALADPRIEGAHNGVLGVTGFEEPAGVVAGASRPGNGKFSVADPRPPNGTWEEGRRGLGVVPWDESAGTVTSQARAGQGGFSVADPRLAHSGEYGQLGVKKWDEPANAVSGQSEVGGGRYAVADPRLIGEQPRFNNCYRVARWADTANAITGGEGPSAGGLAVADPRASSDWKGRGKYLVTPFDEPAGTIIAASTTGNGGFAVADPRPGISGDAFKSAGHYGVIPWNGTSRAVTGAAGHDSGAFSVADPRSVAGAAPTLPAAEERLVAVIRSMDGTWHRPFTTLELAALQGLVDPEEYLVLDGVSDSAWRERIGNAVPAPAAEAIANIMGTTLLLAWAGETFVLSAQSVWVQPIAVAVSVETGGVM